MTVNNLSVTKFLKIICDSPELNTIHELGKAMAAWKAIVMDLGSNN